MDKKEDNDKWLDKLLKATIITLLVLAGIQAISLVLFPIILIIGMIINS